MEMLWSWFLVVFMVNSIAWISCMCCVLLMVPAWKALGAAVQSCKETTDTNSRIDEKNVRRLCFLVILSDSVFEKFGVKKSVDTYAQGILCSLDQLCFSRQICERKHL
jgi:hypothetical protein